MLTSEVGFVQMLLELTRQMDQEKTVLSFSICQVGAEGKMRSFDLSVTSYLQRFVLDYCDVPGNTQAFVMFFYSIIKDNDLRVDNWRKFNIQS